jgi:predicted ester cyclase
MAPGAVGRDPKINVATGGFKMRGPRPEQGRLTQDNDLSKTQQTRATIEGMIDGLNDLVWEGLSQFFHENFRWMGNAGCGTKNGLTEFKEHWVAPFRAAFTDKACVDEARIAEGEWMAAFGHQIATHSGEFMGIAPTGKRVEIRYMDFWKVVNGKIVDNWVMVDFPHVMRQLGVDPFRGQGWEAFDTGQKTVKTAKTRE